MNSIGLSRHVSHSRSRCEPRQFRPWSGPPACRAGIPAGVLPAQALRTAGLRHCEAGPSAFETARPTINYLIAGLCQRGGGAGLGPLRHRNGSVAACVAGPAELGHALRYYLLHGFARRLEIIARAEPLGGLPEDLADGSGSAKGGTSYRFTGRTHSSGSTI